MGFEGDSVQSTGLIGPVVLIHKPLWACGRAAGMAMFHFGQRLKVPSRRGGTKEVGEYGLHVQCGWRVTREEKVLVGSRDLYCPAGFDERTGEIPDDFDWDHAQTRREERFALLFENGTREFEVLAARLGSILK